LLPAFVVKAGSKPVPAKEVSMAQPLVVPDPASVPLPVRSTSSPVSVPVRGRPVTPDCERLDVYRVAVEFQVLAASVGGGRRLGALRDQLDRASVSVVLNIAEGSGHFGPAQKANFYRIARGSAMECLAILDLLAARVLVGREDHRRGRSLLVRVIAMLTKLVAAMERH
jgi:four helix bundle protein